MTSAPSIAFEYRPCAGVWVACALIGVAAAVAGIACAWPWPFKVLLEALLALVLAQAWRRERRLLGWRVSWSGLGDWSLRAPGGATSAAELQGYARRGSMIVLDLRDEVGKRRRFVLTRRNLPDSQHRRLRMRLTATADTA